MKAFSHTLRTPAPMLLGAAGRLAEISRCYPDTAGVVELGSRCADLSRPVKLMTMGTRKGDRVTVRVDGPSENELIEVLYEYFDFAM